MCEGGGGFKEVEATTESGAALANEIDHGTDGARRRREGCRDRGLRVGEREALKR